MILKEAWTDFHPDSLSSEMKVAKEDGEKLYLQSDFFVEQIEEWRTEAGQLLVQFCGKTKFEEVYPGDEIFTK